MTIQHPQETILETLKYNGISVDLVKWKEAVWCGKIGYAVNNTDEPDVEAVLNEFMTLPFGEIKDNEENWDICFSVNYLTADRPNGVMFGFLVSTEDQPDGCDIFKTPAALYMRIDLSEETASALGQEPWPGGIPPHEWIGESRSPRHSDIGTAATRFQSWNITGTTILPGMRIHTGICMCL